MDGLKWRSGAPTVAGWYWHRAMTRGGSPEAGAYPTLVEVREAELSHAAGFVLTPTRGLVALASSLREWDQWAGPIETPS